MNYEKQSLQKNRSRFSLQQSDTIYTGPRLFRLREASPMEIESGNTTLFNRHGNIIKRANDSIQSQNRENLFEDPVSMDSESGSSQDGRKKKKKMIQQEVRKQNVNLVKQNEQKE